MISRRDFTALAAAFGGAAAWGFPVPGRAAQIGADGLHVQPWFLNSFLILSEDLADAAAEGKRFAVVWELEGCPYCKEMHEVNFARDEITAYIKEHFVVLQLNIIGARIVTDFDGEELSEKELAAKWGVRFTPTTVFFPEPARMPEGKTGKEAEVARMPGYLKPFHFLSMYKFVQEKAYLEGKFGPYVRQKIAELKKSGKTPATW